MVDKVDIVKENEALALTIKKGEVLERLMNNRDFKKAILEDYLIHECAKSARNSVNERLSKEDRETELGAAQAAGYLHMHLEASMQLLNLARESYQNNLNAILEMEAEGLE